MVRRKPEPINPNPELPGQPLRERGLEARVVMVTPLLAAQWLEKNGGNRKPRRSRVDTYARDIATGHWHLTGEPLIFDTDGLLRNGQHRLLACIEANASFRSVVIWGVDPAAFRAMDRGAGRTIGDVLSIDGESNANNLAAAAALLFRHEHGLSLGRSHGGAQLTADETIDVVERHPELRSSLAWANGARRVGIAPRLGVFAHYMLAQIDKQAAGFFFDQFYEGTGLYVGHPIKTLRDTLANRSTEANGDILKQYAWIVTAWNHWRVGSNIKVIRWPGPKLPKPE